jgi:histone H3
MARSRARRGKKTVPKKAGVSGHPTTGGKQPIVVGAAKRRYRYKPGSKLITIMISINTILILPVALALREIRKYQGTGDLLIPRAPFTRLVKEIMAELMPAGDFRIQQGALEALQESAEAMLTTELSRKLFLNPYYTNLYTNLI